MGKRNLSEHEREQRIGFAIRCLAIYRHRHQQVQAMRDEFDLAHSTAGLWLKRASDAVIETMKRDRADWVREQVNYYWELSRDPIQKLSDRLNAAKRLDKLLGLEAAAKVQIDSPLLNTDHLKGLLADEGDDGEFDTPPEDDQTTERIVE